MQSELKKTFGKRNDNYAERGLVQDPKLTARNFYNAI